MGGFQKTTYSFCVTPRNDAEREDFAELTASDLKRAFGSGKVWESKVIPVYLLEQNSVITIQIQNSWTSQKVDDLGHFWA
jgi:hypothetical protein